VNQPPLRARTRALKGQRLVALALLGALLFNYPLLQLFARDDLILGIPVLYCYLFCAWAALIGLIALVVERRDPA
jgi:hypothetical protein